MSTAAVMSISKFKATCLGVLEHVRKTGRPLRITRFGEPIADILPPAVAAPEASRLGCMVGTADILGDVVTPVDVAWAALSDSAPAPPARKSSSKRRG